MGERLVVYGSLLPEAEQDALVAAFGKLAREIATESMVTSSLHSEKRRMIPVVAEMIASKMASGGTLQLSDLIAEAQHQAMVVRANILKPAEGDYDVFAPIFEKTMERWAAFHPQPARSASGGRCSR